jgi:hypothetical protein
MNTIALQGGGILGKGQAAALSILEANAGPLSNLFQLCGGTSVGFIMAASIAAGIPMSQAIKFFDADAPKIFHTDMLGDVESVGRLWKSAKYSPAALEASLQSLLGDRTLGDCKTGLIGTAVDMVTGRNVYFQSYGSSRMDDDEIILAPDSGIKLWQAARASSAAQSYFPAFHLNGMVLWDGGGTGDNAPDMLVYTESLTAPGPRSGIRMLSLGAGKMPWPFAGEDLTDPGIVKVLEATLQILFSCGEASEVWQAASFLGVGHVRLNPFLGKTYAIDDASTATLAALEDIWTKAVDSNPDVFSFLSK